MDQSQCLTTTQAYLELGETMLMEGFVIFILLVIAVGWWAHSKGDW